jgi:hypothetical protein
MGSSRKPDPSKSTTPCRGSAGGSHQAHSLLTPPMLMLHRWQTVLLPGCYRISFIIFPFPISFVQSSSSSPSQLARPVASFCCSAFIALTCPAKCQLVVQLQQWRAHSTPNRNLAQPQPPCSSSSASPSPASA